LTKIRETAVLIVGGGPVGLTLAMDLASRGIEVILVEARGRGEAPPPKCNHTSARSMEIFRRLGVAPLLRNAGLPPDYPNDCVYRTTMLGTELARIPIPSRSTRYTDKSGPDGGWPTPEPPHRINQIYLEPILFDYAAAMPKVRILNRTVIEDFTQDDRGVIATARDLANGEIFSIACKFLVGCDGGKSRIRKKMGAALHGTSIVQRVQSTFIRAPKLARLVRGKPGWVNFSLNPRRSGNVMAIDGIEKWIVFNYLRNDEGGFDSVDRDWAIRTILGVGSDFEYDIISRQDWIGRRLVANRFRDQRVFIAGDAAHLWVPYAGYGMNAGIADATNLSWLLAAHLNGWAPAGILDAYESERLPITEQVSHFAMNHAEAMSRQRSEVPAEIELPGAAGDAARASVGKAAYDLNVQQYCCGGLNFGYFYEASPIIAYDGEAAPPYTMSNFTPSTVPGCRTPHLWLAQTTSLYDELGPEFTLLRFDHSIEVDGIERAARRRRFPLKILDVERSADSPYDRKLVLSRPDQHVAWRGNTVPSDPLVLVDLVRGARTGLTEVA